MSTQVWSVDFQTFFFPLAQQIIPFKMMTTNETVSETTLFGRNDCHERAVEYESQILPRFGEFQLLGDGLLVRFADQILQQHPGKISLDEYKKVFSSMNIAELSNMNNVKVSHGIRAVGYCVNGQRIDQLRKRIKTKSYPLSSKVLVMIGTTDVLCGSNINKMTKNFNALLDLLKRTTEKILILTLPPIPKLCVTYFHWTLIRQFNSFLKSLDDGLNIIVADICPIFTKFKGALEYHISTNRELKRESVHYFKKRKSLLNHRRKYIAEQRKLDDLESDKSETDYKNTTDTNSSIDSEIVSSELSQEMENTCSNDMLDEAGGAQVQSKSKKDSERVQSPVRFVVRTLQSVFGKDMLNKKNKTEKKSTLNQVKQPEKRSRNSPFDLHVLDNWEVESDQDSMSEHVYKSQEEMEYDVVEIGRQRKKTKCGEFSKFLESLNENKSTPKTGFQQRKWKRDFSRNEWPETTESSSSSDSDSPKNQICSFIDHNFRYFVEKSCHVMREAEGSYLGPCYSSISLAESLNDAGGFSFSSNSAKIESSAYKYETCKELFLDSQAYKAMESTSERDKLIIHLASKICYLDCYEIFFPFGKKKMNMVHLNRKGLLELKNFLVYNSYVSV